MESTSARAKIEVLSEDRTELLRLLLEENSVRKQSVTAFAREPDTHGRVRVPTSWAQQRLWFIDQSGGGGEAYHISVGWTLEGNLDRKALRSALDTLVQRHEILRTRFVNVDGEPLQEILPSVPFGLREYDLTGYSATQRDAALRQHKIDDARQRFDLCQGPLIRGRLLRAKPHQHVLLVTMHHIISDGWSIEIFCRELTVLYTAYQSKKSNPLQPLPIQYADYAQWQRRVPRITMEAELNYWRTQLQVAAPQLQLPPDRRFPKAPSYRGKNIPVIIDAAVSVGLRTLAHKHNLTIFMVLHSMWSVLLARLSGQEDIVVGVPVANRGRPEIHSLIGFFVNTLALRVRVSERWSVAELLESVKETTLGAYSNQDVPFEQIVEAVHPQRSFGRNPLFQVMFALQNTPRPNLRIDHLVVTPEPELDEPAMFDLLLSLEERENEIVGTLNYATDLFDLATVESWKESFLTLLKHAPEDVNKSVGSLSMLSVSERRRVVESFNASSTAYPSDSSVHELFEERAECYPEAIAVVTEGGQLSYAELNRRANCLARDLWRLGVCAGEHIPLLMQRSVDLLIAQLAVLKLGAVYVPIDPSLPKERQAFIIRDCHARHVLTCESAPSELENYSVQWVIYRSAGHSGRYLDERYPRGLVHSLSPAYVMYTSGSTGVPKGVVVPHRAIVRLVKNTLYAMIERTDCFSHCSNSAFDASTFEIWGALLNGSRVLVVAPSVVLDPGSFESALRRHGVTILWVTIGLLTQYVDALSTVFPQLRYLITGGDVVDPNVIQRILLRGGPNFILNAYGPTEGTTFTTTHSIAVSDVELPNLPIGIPLSNTRVYVLDSFRQPVPPGVLGEIYIGGDGLALGYLNRSDLTVERFTADPFQSQSPGRLYKTGDQGRWRTDGTLDYVGRTDTQVKIRGFRVELEEIETQLGRHPNVGEVVVTTRLSGKEAKSLVAYITPRGDVTDVGELRAERLRTYLKHILPEYMIPSAFVVLDRLPLTPNGKIDRRALPEPGVDHYARRTDESPRTDAEFALVKIWRELLMLEHVGPEDNFFELGGHSLLAIKMIFLVNQQFRSALTVADVYGSPTLRELGVCIERGRSSGELVNLSKEASRVGDIGACPGEIRTPAQAIFLTGGTGFVGRFLLSELLKTTSGKIYCLVRARLSEQAGLRLKSTLVKWNLWREDYESRLVAIPGDLGLPDLGMDGATFRMLQQEVDSIYHCATSMNHLESYEMARRENVDSVEDLLRLASGVRPKTINYISTLSVFSAIGISALRTVSELSAIDEEKHRTSNGYSASKWVGEKVFELAGARGFACNIFRLGLVWADSEQGRYDELQTEYRVLKSCLLSGFGIKNYCYDLAPTPVDYVARSVVYLSKRYPSGRGVFHVSSMRQQVGGVFERWNEISGTALQLVPHYQWLKEVEKLHMQGATLPVIPVVESSFVLSEAAFYEAQRANDQSWVMFDCTQTHKELEAGGIIAPVLDDDLLTVQLAGMRLWDRDLSIGH